MNYLQKPQPKLKEHVRNKTKEFNVPIPIVDDSLPWTHISGIFFGTSVIVENIKDSNILLNQGSFGKKAWPSFNCDNYPILRRRQWKKRKEWKLKQIESNSNNSPLKTNGMKSTSEKLDCNSCMDETDGFNSQDDITNNPEIHHNNKCQSTLLELNEEVVNNVIVINDSDDDFFDGKTYLSKQNPTICTAPVTFQDTLYLTLEEAFFLSFALFCLTVTQMFTRKVLSLNELWKLCNSADSNFVEKYVTYHYFRIKGWIVKSGLNFGCDFALYKRGPAFYHASCLVKIRNINHPNKPKLSWESMMGYCRVAEAAKKDFVLCEVTWPKNIPSNNCDIKDLRKFCVNHKLLQRWTASEHRQARP